MLIAALVAVVGIVAISNVGTQAADKLNTVANLLEESGTVSAGGGSDSPTAPVAGATFNDGVTLTWEELKQSANGTKYGYIANKITDTSIGGFYGCSSLVSMTLPKGITSIKDSTFTECSSLASITLPEGLTSLGDEAFWECSSLASITLPKGLTSIGMNAFESCSSLVSITLPEELTNIQSYALRYCSSLKNVSYAGTIAQWGSVALGTNWKVGASFTQINCSDGTSSRLS